MDIEIGSDLEDNDDCDMDDLFEIPPDLVSESEDLSQYRSDSLPQTFEETPAMEEPFLASYHSPTSHTSALGEAAPLQTPASRQIRTSIPTLPILSSSEQSRPSKTKPGLNNAARQHTSCQAVRKAASRASRPTLPEENTKGPTKTGQGRKRKKRAPFPLSVKRDLTSEDIRPVTICLMEENAVSFFFNNHQSIYETWTASLFTTSRYNSVNESVIVAFDMVHSLSQNKKSNRLKLRFAYIHLTRAIDVLEAALTEHPVHSQGCRNPDYTASVIINTYLNAKKNTSKMSRSHLSEHKRIGRRMYDLTGPSPFQLSIYSESAETIMYVFPNPYKNS